MKLTTALVITLVLLAGVGAHANTIFTLYTNPGMQQSVAVDPGHTLDLLVEMATTDAVGAFSFSVILPMQGWTELAYELSDYGWFENDNLWDYSSPNLHASSPPTLPHVINNDTVENAASPPDFRIDTVWNPLGSTTTGTATVVDFQLLMPSWVIPGTYYIGLSGAEAADVNGVPFSNVYVEDDLQVDVIPEPATLAMVLFGLGALFVGVRRRRG